MLVDNRAILRSLNNTVYNRLVELKNRGKLSTIIVEPSRQGEPTLAILKDGKPVYIHSKYDPKKEVQSYVDSVQDLTETKHIFVIGIGLGYHLEQLLNQYPKLKVTLFEPNIEILYNYVATNKLAKNIVTIFTKLEEVQNPQQMVKNFSEMTATLIWPSYLRLYEAEIIKMQEQLVQNLNSTKRSLVTDISFQRRWIANSLLNYPAVLNSSNIITEKYRQIFESKPVIIVAAGPSLNEEIEEIRKIKEQGSAYLFAVGSGVNVLLHHNIIPDAVFSYDPGKVNQKVLLKIKEQNLTNLPLVFGSSIGFESIIDYPSKKVHMITSADKLAGNLLDIKPHQVILDSPSIAVMTLQVAKKLKMDPIILAGQNLGYLNDVMYGDGGQLARGTNELNERELKNRILTKDIDGNDMYTNEGFLDMKNGLEVIIKQYSHGKVINTTKKGAHIAGAEYITLTAVKETLLTKQHIVENDWVIDELEYEDGIMKFNSLFDDYVRMMTNIDKSVKIANEIKQKFESNIYSKIDDLVREFFKNFAKVIESQSHEIIIKPAIKVQNEKFMSLYKSVEQEKQPRKKAEKFVEIVYSYLGNVYENTEILYPIMQKVKYELNKTKKVDS